MTEEEIKKQTEDAMTRAAAEQIARQVDAAKQNYGAMNRNTRTGEIIGREAVAGGMQAAGVRKTMSDTAGMILTSAGSREREKNAAGEKLLSLKGETAQWEALREGEQARREMEERRTEQEKKLREAMQTSKAETLAQYGDFSGYEEMGYTPEQVRSMKAAWDKQNPAATWSGLSGYAAQLLQIYEKNPGYDISGSLERARAAGLISQQDYEAARLAAAGILPKGRKGGTGGAGPADDGSGLDFSRFLGGATGIDETRLSGEGQLKGSAWDYTRAEVRRLIRSGDTEALESYLEQIGPALSTAQREEIRKDMIDAAPDVREDVTNENQNGSVRVVIDGRPMWLTPTKLLEALETGRLEKVVDEAGRITYQDANIRRARETGKTTG